MSAKGIGYPEQEADFYDIRQGLKLLDYSHEDVRKRAIRAEAAVNRLEAAIAATMKAQAEALPKQASG